MVILIFLIMSLITVLAIDTIQKRHQFVTEDK